MPQGDKSSYTSKQKRKAEHIEEGYEKRGTSKKEAERRAWASVNKSDKGGKKSGSGRGKKSSKASSRKGGRKGGKASGGRKKR
jgi:plasmid stabilization system protein ParE